MRLAKKLAAVWEAESAEYLEQALVMAWARLTGLMLVRGTAQMMALVSA